MENSQRTSGGIGFLHLLTVLFIGLRLTGHITWSWGWVLAPTWIPFALVFAIPVIGVLVVLLITFLATLFKSDFSIREKWDEHFGEDEPECVTWAREHKYDYDHILVFTRAIRDEFDITINQAKGVADKVW